MKIGRGLKIGRSLAGMTQTALAAKLDIRRGYISQMEKGEKHGSVAVWQSAPEALGLSRVVFNLLCADASDHHYITAYEARRLADILFSAITQYAGEEPESEQFWDHFPQPAPTTLINLPDEDPMELWALKRIYQERGVEIESLDCLHGAVDDMLDTVFGDEKRTSDRRLEQIGDLEGLHLESGSDKAALRFIDHLVEHYADHPNLGPLMSAVRDLANDGTVSERVLTAIFHPNKGE